jgi:hypothetical protein
MPPLKRGAHLDSTILLGVALTFAAAPFLAAQDNYEIQVYPSETVAPGRTDFFSR